jgi:hypothetical protein
MFNDGIAADRSGRSAASATLISAWQARAKVVMITVMRDRPRSTAAYLGLKQEPTRC